MKIGIDLGTTNSAIAWMDPSDDDLSIHVFEIPQFVAAGREEKLRTLPSFLYLGDQTYVGAFAREQGALTPTRCVHSAKSWLSNSDVDRTAKILPWDTQESARELSPVDVSAAYLEHMRKAWDAAHPEAPLAQQDIVLTVPASFDEEARELTVAAAKQSGFEDLTLLEEPAAAFYSWIANHLAESRKQLFDGQTVLICDVGGGTSDFTLIKVSRKEDVVEFTRTAVGKHILLGGDNLDLTLGWLVEAKLGKQLSLRQRSALRRQCASAKERMLNNPAVDKVEITVLGAGSSLIGGSLRTEILRAEALELALDGFLPKCALTDRPNDDKRSVFRELGLPYVSDPAVTKHLAAFLAGAGDAVPDAILFNGGFFIPDILRQRVADVLESWFGKRPIILENRDLDLAVAVGSAYYSYAKTTGSGVLVRGGLPRAYFIGVDQEADSIKTVCLAPRAAEEGSSVSLDLEGLQLVANKPVSFRLYSSLTRTEDKLGDVVTFSKDDDLHAHAPLNALIRFGKPQGERLVPVKLGATLTAVGTIEIYCDSKISDNRWRLQFELRKQKAATVRRAAAVISDEARAKAVDLVAATFSPSGTRAPEELPAQLEQALGLGRLSWPLDLIRTLADKFLEHAEGRKKSAAHEARWLNLCGLCLRPGFGSPGDDLRIEQSRRIYAGGLTFGNQVQCEIEWYIFWGRVAGGLNRNQQADVYQRVAQYLLPKGNKKPQRINSSLHREMWRTSSSLELLPAGTRTELGDALVKRVKSGDGGASEIWCIARLGARKLFYAPINQVLPASTAGRWAENLLKAPNAGETLARLCQKTGNVTLDVSLQTVNLVTARLAGDDELLALINGESQGDMDRVFGEELPGGLVLAPVENQQ
ncbi:MAG: molecular chaperone DnaK [Acidobacteria bacterium]|nr:molecular chaperone DnaK [Acidobacteriota bacterium]